MFFLNKNFHFKWNCFKKQYFQILFFRFRKIIQVAISKKIEKETIWDVINFVFKEKSKHRKIIQNYLSLIMIFYRFFCCSQHLIILSVSMIFKFIFLIIFQHWQHEEFIFWIIVFSLFFKFFFWFRNSINALILSWNILNIHWEKIIFILKSLSIINNQCLYSFNILNCIYFFKIIYNFNQF